MSDKDKPTLTREVVTQIRSPFTVGKILDLAERLKGEDRDDPVTLAGGGNMFNPSTLTHRKDVTQPVTLHTEVIHTEPKKKWSFLNTANALEYALEQIDDAEHALDILLRYRHDADAATAFGYTKASRPEMARYVESELLRDIRLSDGSVTRFGTATDDGRGWGQVLWVDKP